MAKTLPVATRKDGSAIDKVELLQKVDTQIVPIEWDDIIVHAEFDLFKLTRGARNDLEAVETRIQVDGGGQERAEKLRSAAKEAGVNTDDTAAFIKFAESYKSGDDDKLTPEQLEAVLRLLPQQEDAQVALAREAFVQWNVDGIEPDDSFWNGGSTLLTGVVKSFMAIYRPTPSASEEKPENSTEAPSKSKGSSAPKG